MSTTPIPIMGNNNYAISFNLCIFNLGRCHDSKNRHYFASRTHYCRICISHNYEFPVCVITNHPPPPGFLSSTAAVFTQSRRHYLIIQEMEIEVNGDGGDETQRKKEILKHSDMALICKTSIWILHINWMKKWLGRCKMMLKRIKIIIKQRVGVKYNSCMVGGMLWKRQIRNVGFAVSICCGCRRYEIFKFREVKGTSLPVDDFRKLHIRTPKLIQYEWISCWGRNFCLRCRPKEQIKKTLPETRNCLWTKIFCRLSFL